MTKKIVLIDMDEVLANFRAHPEVNDEHKNHPAMYRKGFFLELLPIPGALEAVRALLNEDCFDVNICTQPVAESAYCYMEKAQWIWKWFPELGQKIIMVQNKGLVVGDYLIDDNATKWKDKFEANGGEFIHFNIHSDPKDEWQRIVAELLYKEKYSKYSSNP